jgi:hypothetical protein
LSLAAKGLIAFAAVAICGWMLFCTFTNRWPTMLSVKNTADDAHCSFVFGDGFVWNADFESGEEKSWFFPLGEPSEMTGACTTAATTIQAGYKYCARTEPVFTHRISIPLETGGGVCVYPH